MNFRFYFFSLFREIFVPHHRSLEFRAKVLAAMLVAKKTVNEDDYALIREIAIEIYGADKKRIEVLIKTVREYVNNIKTLKLATLDDLLAGVDSEIRAVHRYVKKIDFAHLRRLMIDSDDEDALVQQYVYEYMLDEVARYTNA